MEERIIKEINALLTQLFSKMKEAGYEWDAVKKELKKITSYCQEHCKGYQETGRCFVDGECQAKKNAEFSWSEEDEENLNQLHKLIIEKAHRDYEIDTDDETLWGKYAILDNWLKSIKDRVQPKWKPSDEQMKALSNINVTGIISYAGQGQKLIDLYNDLRKLEE